MIKQLFFLAAFAILLPLSAQSQKLFTRDGKVYFNATAANSPEKIEAAHNSGTFVLDKANGNMEMAVLIKGFYFDRALMQEHFNENYMESSKFPKATFKGKIANTSDVDFSKDGTYKTTVSGNMTMHGVTKPLSAPATFTVKNGNVSAAANFAVTLKDFEVDIPSLVADKIAKQANISITVDLKPL
jgi:polyisoprenoid-binding protein YceI